MSKFFEISELKKQTKSDQYIKNSQFIEKHNVLVSKISTDLAQLPEEGESIDIISIKSFNAFSLILWALKHTPYIQKLYISTYSLSREVSEAVFSLYNDGLIRELHIYISDSMLQRNPFVMDNVKAQAEGKGDVKVVFGWNHTKTSLLEMPDKRFYVFTGSGNFSKNAQYENYILRNSERLFRFYENWFLTAKTKN